MWLVVNVNLNWWNVCIFFAVVYMPRCHQLTDSGDMHICFDFVLTTRFFFFLPLSFLATLTACIRHNYTRARAPHLFFDANQLTDNHIKCTVRARPPACVRVCVPVCLCVCKKNATCAQAETVEWTQIFNTFYRFLHLHWNCIRADSSFIGCRCSLTAGAMVCVTLSNWRCYFVVLVQLIAFAERFIL